jgi:IclR family acetate operon transcriptional repressor
VAAPVIDARGDVVAAVSLSGASLFVTEERQRSLVPAVIACARSISVELGAPLEAGAAA